jgi:hypothetical protein
MVSVETYCENAQGHRSDEFGDGDRARHYVRCTLMTKVVILTMSQQMSIFVDMDADNATRDFDAEEDGSKSWSSWKVEQQHKK